MKNKHVTMRDVAKEAGVSVATVSYVLNYSETEKISHETRWRVFEAVNKLKYIPSVKSKAVTSKKSFLVGIINIGEDNKKSKLYQYYDLIREMEQVLNKIGYDVILIQTMEMLQNIVIDKRRSLDAVFIIDMKEEDSKEITKYFVVPVIFVDTYVKEPLFCKILTDWEDVLKKGREQLGEDYYVILEDYSNKYCLKSILKTVDVQNVFINEDSESLIEFLKKHKEKKGLVIGEILGMQVENYVDNRNLVVVVNSDKDIMLLPDTKICVVSNELKAKKIVEVMNKLLKLENTYEIDEITYIKSL